MKLTKKTSWKTLQQHHKQVKNLHMRDLFDQDTERFKKFSLNCGDLLLDYSKNRITEETMRVVIQPCP